MKEIKFRAWDKIKKEMVASEYYNLVSFEGDAYQFELGKLLKAPELELMQYTGLKDKNGVEIYEGDIIRILYTDWASKPENDPRTLEQYLIEDKCLVGKIVYNAPKFEINFGIGKYGDEDFGSVRHGPHGWIEVIGNIYENQELLKEQTTK